MDARWVLYGLMGGPQPSPNILSTILVKRIQLLGTTLRARSDEYKAELVKGFVKSGCLDKLASGALTPVLDTRSFEGLEAANEALDYLESDKSIGKVCLRVRL